MKILHALLALASAVTGCYAVWTFGPGHELKSIFWLVWAIWVAPTGDWE